METTTKILLAILIVISLPILIPVALIALWGIITIIWGILGIPIMFFTLYPIPSSIITVLVLILVVRIIYIKYR